MKQFRQLLKLLHLDRTPPSIPVPPEHTPLNIYYNHLYKLLDSYHGNQQSFLTIKNNLEKEYPALYPEILKKLINEAKWLPEDDKFYKAATSSIYELNKVKSRFIFLAEAGFFKDLWLKPIYTKKGTTEYQWTPLDVFLGMGGVHQKMGYWGEIQKWETFNQDSFNKGKKSLLTDEETQKIFKIFIDENKEYFKNSKFIFTEIFSKNAPEILSFIEKETIMDGVTDKIEKKPSPLIAIRKQVL